MPGRGLPGAHGSGDAEIRHERVTRIEQDVGWLDVPVDHVAAVRVAQRIGHLACDPERVADRELAFPGEAVPQGLALDVGHDVVDQPIGLVRIVQRQDVRVVETSGDLNLAQESGRSHIGGQLGAEHFHGYRALVLEVVGQEDSRHPALPQFPLDLVAGGKRVADAFEQLHHGRPTPPGAGAWPVSR